MLLTILGVLLFILVLSLPTIRLVKSRAMDRIRENIGVTLLAGVILFNLIGDIPDILLYFLLVADAIVLLLLLVELLRHKSKN